MVVVICNLSFFFFNTHTSTRILRANKTLATAKNTRTHAHNPTQKHTQTQTNTSHSAETKRQQAQAARLAAPSSPPTSFQAVAKVTVKAEF